MSGKIHLINLVVYYFVQIAEASIQLQQYRRYHVELNGCVESKLSTQEIKDDAICAILCSTGTNCDAFRLDKSINQCLICDLSQVSGQTPGGQWFYIKPTATLSNVSVNDLAETYRKYKVTLNTCTVATLPTQVNIEAGCATVCSSISSCGAFDISNNQCLTCDRRQSTILGTSAIRLLHLKRTATFWNFSVNTSSEGRSLKFSIPPSSIVGTLVIARFTLLDNQTTSLEILTQTNQIVQHSSFRPSQQQVLLRNGSGGAPDVTQSLHNVILTVGQTYTFYLLITSDRLDVHLGSSHLAYLNYHAPVDQLGQVSISGHCKIHELSI